MHTSKTLRLCTLILLAAPATAQSHAGFLPFDFSGDAYVVDTSSDSVMRLRDLNFDGNFNGTGETSILYSDSAGPIPLGNNSGITVDSTGRLFLSDSTEDSIFVLHDGNGDGTCYDPGEIVQFFDGDPMVNASGIDMGSPQDLTIDLLGNVYIASASSGTSPDSIIRLQDLNADGDANDAGEASYYYLPPILGSSSDSLPNDVFIGQDGALYYVEGGTTGVYAKAVYRMNDNNQDGMIDPALEVSLFFDPPAQAGSAFFWSVTQDLAGNFYMADTGNDLIWKFRDTDHDGVVDAATEANIWWQSPSSSLIWDLTAHSDGSIYAAESQSPDRILRFFDADSDGVIDPLGEVAEVYSEDLSATDIVNPRGIIFERYPTLSVTASAPLGSVASISTIATAGDIYTTYWSTGSMAPLLAAPFGFVEIATGPGHTFGALPTGTMTAAGTKFQVLNVPSDPLLVGLTFYFQSVVGKPDRFQITRLQPLTLL